MKIELTQSDIDDGEPCNGYRCGFALALNRQLPGSYPAVRGTLTLAAS